MDDLISHIKMMGVYMMAGATVGAALAIAIALAFLNTTLIFIAFDLIGAVFFSGLAVYLSLEGYERFTNRR